MSITQTQHSPHAKVRSVGLEEARWTRGFWAERFANCRDAIVPTMGRLMSEGSERVKFIGNFLVAAGMEEGRHRGPRWNDGDFYKWLESAAAVYAQTKDPKLDSQMDELIALIARAQDADGYIHTDVQIRQKSGEDVKRFGNPMDFEMYNMGHLISAAVVHRRATGKTNLLAIARKAADFLDQEFADPKPDQARHGICPAHLMALSELYRETKVQRYLDLAVRLLNMRDLVAQGDDDNQDRIPFRKQTTAHGHAVRATYLYAGAADLFLETGDASILAPLEPIWRDLVSHKLYITGGCGALYDGASPDGTPDQKVITRIHQAFGRDYQLPHSTAHNETCAAIGSVLWNWRMLHITGESRFGDVIEQTLFNSVLNGVSLDGTAFFYTQTLRQLNPMPVELRWPRTRAKVMGCWCCPPNVARTVAESANLAYAINDRGVYVVLFGGSTLETSLPDGTPIKLTQETNYPWDGKVRITIDATLERKEWSLFVRIPEWARDASVRVKGQGAPDVRPGSFCEIRRPWVAGDVVEVDLPMPVRLVEANPYVEETRNQVAVMRGPIVYCLESVDLPADVRVLDILLPVDAKLTPLGKEASLGGVATIGGKARVRPSGDWSGALYRDVSASASAREIDVTLIPYFAWDNRGTSEMTVWLPCVIP